MKERKYVQAVILTDEEVKKIACAILGIDVDTLPSTAISLLWEEFGIGSRIIRAIASRLLPLVHVSYDEKTKEQHKGFALDGKWLAERKCLRKE